MVLSYSAAMEWLAGMVAAVVAFFASLVPTLGEEVRYRMSLADLLAPQEATVLFGGDMMFDRSVRVHMELHGDEYVFSCIVDTLNKPDLVVANLEGPITDNPSVSVGSTPGDSNNFTFTFPTSTATLLYKHNIRLVNIGNNHIMNFGRDGLLQTKKSLEEANVSFFGTVGDDSITHRITIRGVPLSFVNYNEFSYGSTDMIYHISRIIGEEREAGRVVVVYTHWGEEYVPPTERMKRLARSFIDAGADIVIGSHPHIVQEHEVYEGKHIYYSLGNFIFDQYWEDAVRDGMLIEARIDTGGVKEIKEIQIRLERDRRTCPKE
jgi:gamma-polyglutamate biosynthesis protein CapA